MSQQETLYHWCEEIRSHMVHLKKPQVWMLAAASLGLALAERCTLTRVAKEIMELGKEDSVERRLQRFLSNERIRWADGCRALAAWVISSVAARQKGLVVLLVDETSLKDRLKVMAVSLAYQGRAIPLAWWCYHQERWPMGQVELITTLLQWVKEGMPSGTRVVVEADRGIGSSPALLRAIQEMGWYYLVRVPGHVRLIVDDGRDVSFNSLAPRIGSRWRGDVQAFKKAGWLRCWAVAVWEEKYAEPWLLLTNYPRAQGNWYSRRMWEEMAFKDFKSSGWQWQRSHVWNPNHANRLWLVMALAYVWMISMGTRVQRTPKLRAAVTRGTQERCSVFQLGLRFLYRSLKLGHKLFYQLVLFPSLRLRPKSVV